MLWCIILPAGRSSIPTYPDPWSGVKNKFQFLEETGKIISQKAGTRRLSTGAAAGRFENAVFQTALELPRGGHLAISFMLPNRMGAGGSYHSVTKSHAGKNGLENRYSPLKSNKIFNDKRRWTHLLTDDALVKPAERGLEISFLYFSAPFDSADFSR